MEPANLTPFRSDHDPVESWLRAKAVDPLPDNGFSARVIAALPPSPASFSWRRLLLCAGGTLCGLAFAWSQGGDWPDGATLARLWNVSVTETVQLLENPWWSLAFASVIVAAAVAFAVQTMREPPPELEF
jgi:hypothetical protein